MDVGNEEAKFSPIRCTRGKNAAVPAKRNSVDRESGTVQIVTWQLCHKASTVHRASRV